jgi:hypothetical protein
VRNLEFTDLIEAARVHYENLKTDIANASTRLEHVRLTALAQEAQNLYAELRGFNAGLVYTHTAARANEQIWEESQKNRDNELDFIEFKSPFNPDMF